MSEEKESEKLDLEMTEGVMSFYCNPCKEKKHEECPGDTWCFCGCIPMKLEDLND